MPTKTEQQKVLVEIIATLTWTKDNLTDYILKPAGIPSAIYGLYLNRRDETTGKLISKRRAAPLILDAIADIPSSNEIVKKIIQIAADWQHFHLAYNEYEARATVQKARELLGSMSSLEHAEAVRLQEELRHRQGLLDKALLSKIAFVSLLRPLI
jgi:hypothetical protein